MSLICAQCGETIYDEENAIMVTPDADFVHDECEGAWNDAKEAFFNGTHDDQWFENWMNEL